ncbi:hypothetical protein D3C81_1654950 [compost metagenome]
MQTAHQAQQITVFEPFPAVLQRLVLHLAAQHPVLKPGRIVAQQGEVWVVERALARRVDKQQVAWNVQGEGVAVLAVRECPHAQDGIER